MQRTKISWVRNHDGTQGYTWNIVTGCLHGCGYCYARRIMNRFGKTLQERDFQPVLYFKRLNNPLKLKKPSTIFVCSMADLFGEWIPNDWLGVVFKVIEKCPQHTFLFLTKNGARLARHKIIIDSDNVWYGQSCTGLPNSGYHEIPCRPHIPSSFHQFVSFEPLIGDCIPDLTPCVNWVIIGSLNQNSRPIHPDKGGTRKEWVVSILQEADRHFIPVFIKPELYQLYPDLPVRQELPYLGGKL